MKTWAIINISNNVVTNCIYADSEATALETSNFGLETPIYKAVEYWVPEPGWSYIDNVWIPSA